MALLAQRILRGLLPAIDTNRPRATRTRPERIILGVRPGQRPSSRPPVRIFLGSERNQFRAERVFLWSVEKNRDPSRIYEIYLLKSLTGFSGRFWLTGFTNYRFAIPYYSDYKGRAIYNDTDQIYLRDPAELFDQDMGQAGFLSISDRDTSVMLIDCARMRDCWRRDSIFRDSRKQLEARARGKGLWGPMDAGWNARDAEYEPGNSALVHFTTLHTQPWRPLPDQYVYFDNPTGTLWNDLEDEADRAGFMPVSARRPSSAWPDFALWLTSRRNGIALRGLFSPEPPPSTRERIKITDLLEHVPDADLPWVLDRAFSCHRDVRIRISEPLLPRRGRERRSRDFWLQQLQRAGRLNPGTRWKLKRRTGLKRDLFAGGPAPAGPILALFHKKPGHDHQALAVATLLAKRTGRELRTETLTYGPASLFLRRLIGLAPRFPGDSDAGVIVAAGWYPTRVARRLTRADGTRPRLVLMGRKAGKVPEQGGVVIGCRHFGLPPHPNRIECVLPLNLGGSGSPDFDESSWRGWSEAPKRAAVLVGGPSRSHRMDAAEAARLGRAAAEWAERRKAELLVIGSRRTGDLIEAIVEAAGPGTRAYRWRAGDKQNPYHLALRSANALLITGESESMLADAVRSGKPVFIWPLPRRRSLWSRLSAALARRAGQPRYNRRGSIRPQQGLAYLCARALERAWFLPERDLKELYEVLIGRGVAAWFGSESVPARSMEPELDGVIDRVITSLELYDPPGVLHREDSARG